MDKSRNMKKKQVAPVTSSTPVDGFVYNPEIFSPKEFIEKHAGHFPKVVRIEEGFCSPDEGKFTFGSDEVYFIIQRKRHKRIIGKSDDDLNYSIPCDHPMKFMVHERNQDPFGPNTLEEMFMVDEYDESKIIDLVPAESVVVTLWQGAGTLEYKKIPKLRLYDAYDETNLIASPVCQHQLFSRRIAIPIFVPISLSVATGLSGGKDKTDFDTEIARLKEFSAKTAGNQAPSNGEIMIFTDEQVECYGGAYEIIDPYETLENVRRLSITRPDDDDDDNDDDAPCPPSKLPPRVGPRPHKRPIEKKPDLPTESQTDPTPPRKPPPSSPATKPDAPPKRERALDSAMRHVSIGNVYSPPPPLPARSLPEVPPSGVGNAASSTDPQPPHTNTGDNDTHSDVSSDDDADDYERPEFDNIYPEIKDIPKDIDFKQVSSKQLGMFLRLLKIREEGVRLFKEQDVDGALLLHLSHDMLVNDFKLTGTEATKLRMFVHDGWRSK